MVLCGTLKEFTISDFGRLYHDWVLCGEYVLRAYQGRMCPCSAKTSCLQWKRKDYYEAVILWSSNLALKGEKVLQHSVMALAS